MKFEHVLQLAEVISASALTEFNYEEGSVKISMRKEAEGQNVFASDRNIPFGETKKTEEKLPDTEALPLPGKEQFPGSDAEKADGQTVTSPLVGTFYAAPSEEADPFVRVGDTVEKGQVLAIIEAMKLMNEIESDFSGKVEKILVENGEAVEYGQPLFLIR